MTAVASFQERGSVSSNLLSRSTRSHRKSLHLKSPACLTDVLMMMVMIMMPFQICHLGKYKKIPIIGALS